eukprot:10007417-Alexandrium_andersonii.AAC.1
MCSQVPRACVQVCARACASVHVRARVCSCVRAYVCARARLFARACLDACLRPFSRPAPGEALPTHCQRDSVASVVAWRGVSVLVCWCGGGGGGGGV